ncbi:MAG: YceD family protein [Nitrosomonas sp.]|nr:MAG: YceD family protein [Nitrosomonas sp.]
MPVRIIKDPLEFVRSASIRHGKIAIVELTRLHDYLFNSTGELAFQVMGQVDENEKPGLRLEVRGTVQLICQRCLDQLTHHIDIKSYLILARNEMELQLADTDVSIDAILVVPELDLYDLIEDEVILGLSISARHTNNECSMLDPDPQNRQHLMNSNNQTANPFAALASLKKH